MREASRRTLRRLGAEASFFFFAEEMTTRYVRLEQRGLPEIICFTSLAKRERQGKEKLAQSVTAQPEPRRQAPGPSFPRL
eukprot:scaffold395_cov243-Pinguiococcus_pyrenoidosus.AAC.40